MITEPQLWRWIDFNVRSNKRLYNWSAINDKKGLAPLGWKIPSYKDWMKLINYLGGEEVAGYKLKSSSDLLNEAIGDNSSGFNASPSSTYLDLNEGWFTAPNDFASFWTSTVNNIGGQIL